METIQLWFLSARPLDNGTICFSKHFSHPQIDSSHLFVVSQLSQ